MRTYTLHTPDGKVINLQECGPLQGGAADELCCSCRFFQDSDPRDAENTFGYCRRYPPVACPPEGQHGWPLIDAHDWCGEYERAAQ